MQKTLLGKFGFLWVTAAFFVFSFVGHWIFGWYAYADEQRSHNEAVDVSGYLIEMGRDTLENWQSEFLQLMWQVAGLSFLLYVGSPQSKEGDDRKEEKLDLILEAVRKDGKDEARRLAAKYPKH